MKKKYIFPTILSVDFACENDLLEASITGINRGDLNHDIEIGGDAAEGLSSDSRRGIFWEDEY